MIDQNEYDELLNGLEAVQRLNADSRYEESSALLNVIIARRILRDAEEVSASITFMKEHQDVVY